MANICMRALDFVVIKLGILELKCLGVAAIHVGKLVIRADFRACGTVLKGKPHGTGVLHNIIFPASGQPSRQPFILNHQA